MKFPGLLRLAAIGIVACRAVHASPQPEDPLLTGNVATPLTPGVLYLRELTQPPGLYLWRTLKDLETLNTAQLRTLVHRVWMVSRRYARLAGTEVLIDAWAERDPGGIVADMLTIMRWEDEDPLVGDYDIDIESEAARQWCRLAERDWPRALSLLGKLNDGESGTQFREAVSSLLVLPPDRLPAFTAAFAPASSHPDKVMERIVWASVKAHGLPTVKRAVAKITNKRLRPVIQAALQKAPNSEDGPQKAPPAPPRLESVSLQRLLALDSGMDKRFRFPFPLLREVLKLTPEEALQLALQLPRDPQPPGDWLAWTLFMRAADGDPVAAQPVAAGLSTAGLDVSHPLTTLYALRADMDLDKALQEMRAMTSVEDQRDALSGYLTGHPAQEIIVRQLGSPLMAFVKQVELPAHRWRSALNCAAAAGSGEAALEVAATIQENSKASRPGLEAAVVQAWALSDLASLDRYSESLKDPARSDQVTRDFGTAIPWLPVSAVLNPDKPLSARLLTFAPGMHWPFLAREAREETFRFLEGHAKESVYRDVIGRFTEAATRHAPERAMMLHRLAGFEGETDLVSQIVLSHGDEPKVLASTFSTDRQWEFAGYELARHHSDNILALLKNTPGTHARRGAALFFLESAPEKAGPLSKYLTEEERHRLTTTISAKKR